ncbi:MAG TPA: NAD(P)H-hydrate dehydratase [Gemmatimonadaceae bacterium]|nr:NAD(P)H-hydrate dehydratase [Gemmatimonadaceae bacterium]
MRPLIRVVTGPEAAARDASTIAAGVPSRALMQRAGAAAAAEIAARYPENLKRGALVLAGPGNNGGDGWVIARALADAGAAVNVLAPDGARSPDCVAEREVAGASVSEVTEYSGEGVVIDALLGTGSTGKVRGAIGDARSLMIFARDRGAAVVAIDLPSGLDATSGAANDAISADLTITFGTVKRGHLVSRGLCGAIVVMDIGLLPPEEDGLELVDADWVRGHVPPIAAESHKGTRKKLVIHGGAPGMAGAVVLGVRAALASGIGMVKARVHPSVADAIHGAVPQALVDPWPGVTPDVILSATPDVIQSATPDVILSEARDPLSPDTWADVLVIGPGLGPGARAAVERAAARHAGPMVLDADALTAFAGDLSALRAAIGDRPALITPHPIECARLLGIESREVLDRRFDIGAELAREIGATVLLKGVPTVISDPDGRRLVVAAGTPTLATGGSGDVLCGIAGTLLAQMDDALIAGACAAWIHGRAAELSGPYARGTTLDDVLGMLPNAWRIPEPSLRYPVLAELPAVSS